MPDRSLDEIIHEQDFQLLLEARARPYFQLLNLLRSRPDFEFNKKLLWKVREEAHALETFLDDFGARNNKTFSYFTEAISSVRNFALALFELHHLKRRYRRYVLLDDAAHGERFLEATRLVERRCRRNLMDLMLDSERDAREFLRLGCPSDEQDVKLLTDPLPTTSLPQNVDEGEILDEAAKVGEIATKFLRAVEKWKVFRYRPLNDTQELRRFILTRFNEETARKAEGIIHNLQAKYDTYIKGTVIESEVRELPVLRGHLSVALHLFGVAQHLVHFYERHENDVRFELTKKAISAVVDKHDILDQIVNYALFFAGDYLERAEPSARELVKRYVRECEKTLLLRDGIRLHARPATLIVRVVNHYGTPVQMILDGQSCDARSITGILLLSGTHLDAREVTFRGDQKPLEDLEKLFLNNLGGDDMSGLPADLAYLRD